MNDEDCELFNIYYGGVLQTRVCARNAKHARDMWRDVIAPRNGIQIDPDKKLTAKKVKDENP